VAFFVIALALLLLEGGNALADQRSGNGRARGSQSISNAIDRIDKLRLGLEVELPRRARLELELHWCSVR